MRPHQPLPQWIHVQIHRLARLPQHLPIEEVVEPVWRMPRAVQSLIVILCLGGLVGGVRVLDAQIALQSDGPRAYAVPDSLAMPASSMEPAWTGLLVESPPASRRHQFVPITVSGYCSQPEFTDATPELTASATPVRPGTLALSRDLLRTFTPNAPFDFGDRVLIPGMGIYVVEDTMNPRWTHKGDIWFTDVSTARRWGVRQVYLAQVEAGAPVLVPSQWHP